jgi:HAD superfamily hydrolase (TIGR01450 family)
MKLIDKYDGLLLDLDGVVYRGQQAIPQAIETIGKLASKMPIGYVTNNASRTQAQIAEQLRGYGIELDESQVISSAMAAAEMLSEQISGKVLVIGGDGLVEAVREYGFEVVVSADDRPDAVIQGFSPDIGWRDLAEASYAINNGALWLATNQDWTIPLERGIAPGNGTLVSAVHTAVGHLPEFAGKPARKIFDTAKKQLGIKTPLFIGDRIDTDILGANNAEIDSALVFTGIATGKETISATKGSRPTYLLESIGEILEKHKPPKKTKYGYKSGSAQVELLGNKVRLINSGARIEVLRAACSVVWESETAIYGLDVQQDLYWE